MNIVGMLIYMRELRRGKRLNSAPTNTRWKLVRVVMWLSSFAFFLPHLINWIAQFMVKDYIMYEPLILLGSQGWITLILAVIGMYKLSNIAQDKIFNDNIQFPKEDEKLEDEGD